MPEKRETAHTVEPWTIGRNGDVHDSGGRYIYLYRNHNARRIVACVNACAGIKTERLEGTKLLPALYNSNAIIDAEARADAAEALLRECTDRLRSCIVAAGSHAEYADIAVQHYRDFLAKAPGQ